MTPHIPGTRRCGLPASLRQMVNAAVCSSANPWMAGLAWAPCRAMATRSTRATTTARRATGSAGGCLRGSFSRRWFTSSKVAYAAKQPTAKRKAGGAKAGRSAPAPARPPSDTGVVRSFFYVPPHGSAASLSSADQVRPAPPPSSHALERATSLFLQPAPRFLYSAPRFLHLPPNTRMPEICILGRSNVGKSTLLNALSGLETGGKAGRSHGARPGRAGLAITSARAGCTTMMNGYGFGPPLRPAQYKHVVATQKTETAHATLATQAMLASAGSRSQRRAAQHHALAERPPAHSLVLLDMPGYGFMSQSAWGVEIAKYLQRRAALRGAVLLVDAVAGIKDGDYQALALLRDANVRTLVLLTKADKLVSPSQLPLQSPSLAPGAPTDGDYKLRQQCLRVWDTLRDIEREASAALPWTEGHGWDRAICITGAGDPNGGGFGVAGARLAIARMAGLLPAGHNTAMPASSRVAAAAAAVTRSSATSSSPLSRISVVPFDQIQWSDTGSEPTIDQSEELRFIAEQELARQKPNSRSQVSAGRRRPWSSRLGGSSSDGSGRSSSTQRVASLQ